MTSKSWRQLMAATLLAASAVGCSGNGGLLRRFNGNDDCDTCHYGCCDNQDGGMSYGGMGYGDGGGMSYGGMGCGDGGCTSCGQTPNLMPIGPDMMGQGMMGQGMIEQVPSQPLAPGGTYIQPVPAPRGQPTPVRPGPVQVE